MLKLGLKKKKKGDLKFTGMISQSTRKSVTSNFDDQFFL